MRRLLAVLPLSLIVLAACGGPTRTAAEDAYLTDLKANGSTIELSDPDGKLEQGHLACDSLSDFKPGSDRAFAKDQLQQRPDFGYLIVTTAIRDLCPEMATV